MYKKEAIILSRYSRIYTYYLSILLAVVVAFMCFLIYQRTANILSHTDDPGKEMDVIRFTDPKLMDDVIVQSKQTLQSILSLYQIPAADIQKVQQLAKSNVGPINLKAGQLVQVTYSLGADQQKYFTKLSLELNKTTRLEITKDNDQFLVKSIPILFEKETVKFSGTVHYSIINSATKLGIPMQNVLEAINAYRYTVDFQRDLKEGDKFEMVVEKFTSKENNKVRFGKTIFASLSINGKPVNIYRFSPSTGIEDFYSDNFASVKKSLLKTPVPVVKISSGFGIRKHPVLGYSRMHKGVDFAAAPGTPIFAAGNGSIVEIGRKGNYGKYIKIKHNKEIQTAYAHISNFTKGLRVGSKVRQGQVIAYVGSSGISTGPHLHYEIIYRGQQVDPLKFKSLATTQLSGKDLEKFKQFKQSIDGITTTTAA